MKRKKQIWSIVSLLFLNIFFGWHLVYDRQGWLMFANIGQGDGVVVKTAYGQVILIDGGPTAKILEELGLKLPYWKRKIDVLILSHPHNDHFQGQIEVIKRYDVDMVLWNGEKEETPDFLEWDNLIKSKNIKRVKIFAGNKVIFNEHNLLEVVWPREGYFLKDENDNSLIFKFASKKKSFLFTGDVSAKILDDLSGIEADVLKVPHHGSKHGLSNKTMWQIRPKEAVISVGKNSFGHPSPQILELLDSYNVKIHITQEGNKIYSF